MLLRITARIGLHVEKKYDMFVRSMCSGHKHEFWKMVSLKDLYCRGIPYFFCLKSIGLFVQSSNSQDFVSCLCFFVSTRVLHVLFFVLGIIEVYCLLVFHHVIVHTLMNKMLC